MKSSSIVTEIISILNSVSKNIKKPVALHQPFFDRNEWRYVKDCIDSGWVSSVGTYVDKFEQMLADFTGIKRAVAVVNGTAALHVSLLLTGVQKDDEVLTPTLSFVATANATTYCGAIPHFVDSSYKTLGVDPIKLENYLKEIVITKNKNAYNKLTGRIIRCLVVMHTFGHPAELDTLKEICDKYHIALIEDAAESLGSYYKNKHTGSWGLLSCISFNGNKTITTGGGGAILTNDDKLADQAKHITTTAKVSHPWKFYHDRIAYNYRMPNINAALGVAQIEQLPNLIKKKRTLAKEYEAKFNNVKDLQFFKEPTECKSNYWLNTIILDENQKQNRDLIIEEINASGFQVRPCWNLMHTLPMFQSFPRMDLSQAKDIASKLINIPSSPNLR